MKFWELIEQKAMFNWDISVVCLFLLIGVFIKDKAIRLGLWVGGLIYLFFAVLWHMPVDWSVLY
jgi:hypothetical protein